MLHIKPLNFFPDNPRGHRIYVTTDHVTTEAVGLNQRRATTHEGIGNPETREIVGFKEQTLQVVISELRQHEPTKQRPGTPGKPFVDSNNRPVTLLDLLFLQRHSSNERDVEALLNAHDESRADVGRSLSANSRVNGGLIILSLVPALCHLPHAS